MQQGPQSPPTPPFVCTHPKCLLSTARDTPFCQSLAPFIQRGVIPLATSRSVPLFETPLFTACRVVGEQRNHRGLYAKVCFHRQRDNEHAQTQPCVPKDMCVARRSSFRDRCHPRPTVMLLHLPTLFPSSADPKPVLRADRGRHPFPWLRSLPQPPCPTRTAVWSSLSSVTLYHTPCVPFPPSPPGPPPFVV